MDEWVRDAFLFICALVGSFAISKMSFWSGGVSGMWDLEEWWLIIETVVGVIRNLV